MNAPLPTLPGAADSAGALSGSSQNPSAKQRDSNVPGGFGAALREAVEETGLAAADFKLWARLGSDTIQPPPGGPAIRRHCYHFEFLGKTPETWIHAETDPSDGSPAPIEFELTWVTYPDEVPTLAGNQGAWLNRLKF